MTLPLHAAPYALSMSLIEDEVDANRYDACPCYERCLDHAVAADWASWSCSCCVWWPDRSGTLFMFSREDLNDDEPVVVTPGEPMTKKKTNQVTVGAQLSALGWKIAYHSYNKRGGIRGSRDNNRRLAIAYTRGTGPGLEKYTFAIQSEDDQFSKKAAHLAILRRIQSGHTYDLFDETDVEAYFDLTFSAQATHPQRLGLSDFQLMLEAEDKIWKRGYMHTNER